jgi:hypothetical protein
MVFAKTSGALGLADVYAKAALNDGFAYETGLFWFESSNTLS